MTAPAASPSWRDAVRRGLHCLLLALPLWLSLLHLPTPLSIEIFDARPMALDYAVRRGIGLGTALPSDIGPVGALLTPTHSGQPVDVNYRWHLFVGAALALGLSWLVLRVSKPARWWLLGGLIVLAAFRAEYLHASAILLFGLALLSQPVGRLEAAAGGALLGILGLINVQFAWLGAVVVLSCRAHPSPGGARTLAIHAGTMLPLVLVTGWLWTGQPAGDLWPWLLHGLAPASLRHQAAAWSSPALAWGCVAFSALAAALAGTVAAAASRRREAVPAAFVCIVLFLTWRRATGHPETGPQLFLVTAAMAALAWIALKHSPAPRRWPALAAAGAVAAAAAGLLAVEPRILTQSVQMLNRNIATNVAALAKPAAWRDSLESAFRGSAELFSLPRIKAATAGGRTDLLGNATGYIFVNQLEFAPRPGLQSYRVAGPELAARDAAYYAGPGAPDFVVQRLQAFDRGLPALEDASAQLALYAGYEFQFEENGFVLWKRRPGTPEPVASPAIVWQGQAQWDQPVALPVQPGRAYWLTIDTSRSLVGWLRSRLLAPADPTLQLRDTGGESVSYRASPESLATGFLLAPLFRGEVDLIRYQAGDPPVMVREITLQKPATTLGDFSGPLAITLHEVPAPAVSGRRESADEFARRFRIADRLPLTVNAYFPPQVTNVNGKDVLLAHPDSSLEFPVHAGDVSVQGGFGLLDGAHQNGNATDGVEFVVEYLPTQGSPVVLFRRHLKPVSEPNDRGLQSFAVALPTPASGRIVLRTQNPPGYNAAWDWSLWTDLRFTGAPATK
jgi:hypothetical protein